jgi:hypothetical protein
MNVRRINLVSRLLPAKTAVTPLRSGILFQLDSCFRAKELRFRLSQHLIRAIIAVAAFAGLREGEIRGQWWEDDEGHIRRSVRRTYVK